MLVQKSEIKIKINPTYSILIQISLYFIRYLEKRVFLNIPLIVNEKPFSEIAAEA